MNKPLTTAIITENPFPLQSTGGGRAEFSSRPAESPRPTPEDDSFFNLAGDLFGVLDFEGRFQRVNPAWKTVLGFTPADMHHRLLSDFIRPEDRPAAIECRDSAVRQGQPAVFEARFLSHDGASLWLQCNVVPVPDRRLLYATARDITEQKIAEAEIQKLAAFPRLNPCAIFEFSPNGTLTYFNDAALEMARVCGEREPAHLLPTEASTIVANCLSRGQSRLRYETQINNRAISWSFYPIRSSGVVHAYASDITERKDLEAQFLRAQRLESIGALASGVAHDLNNILAPILMSVNLLQEMVTTKPGLRLLEVLQSSAQRGAEMVNQILSFSKGQEQERAPLQLRHLISEITKIIRETFPKNIQVRTETAKDLWLTTANPTQIHQVLMNLCVNARDAMPNGGTLLLQAENIAVTPAFPQRPADRPPGPYVALNVSDTGTGIPPEIMEKIWEPFFSLKPPGQGTGLGLSTVLSIVKNHGGFITTESKPGQGTRFRIFLPAAPAAAQPAAAGATSTPPAGQHQKLLVVDDERAFLEIIKAIFSKHGYQVLTACDGTEALALFAQQHGTIDLVLTDMVMPPLDGPATISALREIDPNVRIIATSGLLENEALAAGVPNLRFLLKPFTTEKLLATVRDALQPSPALQP